MRMIPAGALKTNPREVWDAATDECVVITAKGQPVALVTNIVGWDVKEVLREYRAFRAYTAARRMHRRSRVMHTASLTLAEVNREIRLTRQSGKQRRSKRS